MTYEDKDSGESQTAYRATLEALTTTTSGN